MGIKLNRAAMTLDNSQNAETKPFAAAILLACTLCVFSTPSLAQSALEEVVVTAQRREQSIQDIYFSLFR